MPEEVLLSIISDFPYRFKSEYNLNRHMRKHLQKEVTPQQIYKCSYCEMEFTKKQQLRKHEFVFSLFFSSLAAYRYQTVLLFVSWLQPFLFSIISVANS